MSLLDVAQSIAVLRGREGQGLAFFAPNGRLVTCFHLVAGEAELTAELFDGRLLPVRALSAADPRHDLACLDLGATDVASVRATGALLADEATPVAVFWLHEGRLRWHETTVDAVQVLGTQLTVYRLAVRAPAEAAGGPLLTRAGEVLGVVTLAESDEGVVTLGMPWRYVEGLLPMNLGRALADVAKAVRRAPRRHVPEHPLSLLEGSTLPGLAATTEAIAGAIRVGAPAYNEGDIERCYRVYADTARQLISSRGDCPGVRKALRLGLERAEQLSDVDQQAWAMRDAFDGILLVIERFMRDRQGATGVGRRRGLVN